MSHLCEEFDLIVIGGGPGGSTVASFVAMRGHKVLLLEKEHFPRYSLGESLLPVTVNGICKLLGVREKLERANFVVKYGATWRWGRDHTLWSFHFNENTQLNHEKFDYAYQVERSKFDDILLRHAQEMGVDVREKHKVLNVIIEEGRTVGVRFTDPAGVERSARARFIVDASGHQSKIYQVAGDRVLSKFFRNVAMSAYYANARRRPQPRDGDILCAAFDLGWFWFIPLSDVLTSVGVVIAPEHVNLLQGDREKIMRALISQCPVVAELLQPATRITEGDYGKFRIRRDYSYCNTKFYSPGLMLVGDTACFIDPVFSSGVHLATYSALLAARTVNSSISGDIEESSSLEEFEHRYLAEFRTIYEFLLVIYDMNHDKNSYFWNARKIINTKEATNEAFVRLVSGLGTTSTDFFAKRRNAGDACAPFLQKHFYDKTHRASPVGSGIGMFDPELKSVLALSQKQREDMVGEKNALVFSNPFPEIPVRPDGLVPSEDGLSWRRSKKSFERSESSSG